MARILLGVTGSVAAIRTPQIVHGLRDQGHDVRVAATEPSLYFFDPRDLDDSTPLHRDRDEWPGASYRRGDPILHIELRNWADLLLIAPTDANTLAKIAYGLSDNLLTCIVRAWKIGPERPILLAPAMNTAMWESSVTLRHLRWIGETYGSGSTNSVVIDKRSMIDRINAFLGIFQDPGGPIQIIAPIAKQLACGDEGMGAMAEVPEILQAVEGRLTNSL